MRIQETDRILKESRYARNAANHSHQENDGMATRAWKMLSDLPSRFTGLFKHR
jgi:hypothetical protein